MLQYVSSTIKQKKKDSGTHEVELNKPWNDDWESELKLNVPAPSQTVQFWLYRPDVGNLQLIGYILRPTEFG